MKDNGTADIVDKCMSELKQLNPKIANKSKHGSVYIRFHNPNLGQLRISDHDEIDGYDHKWNLRKDLTGWTHTDGRHYWGWDRVDLCIKRILKAAYGLHT